MLERLKTALVDSFVGAIAIGLLFAEGIQRVAYTFSEPMTRWLMERTQQQSGRLSGSFLPQPKFPIEIAIPYLFAALFLLAVAFVMLRWLYFPAAKEQDQTEATK